MITLEQAKQTFEKLIREKSGYTLDQVAEIDVDDPVYVVIAVDQNGDQVMPGQVFPAIRKRDGAVVDFDYICPA